ncbi:MAG: endolytic transglycosylase MltG [Acidimicrobiia bacterium]
MTFNGYGDDEYGNDLRSKSGPLPKRPPRTPQERRALNRSVRRTRPKPGALAIVLLILLFVIGGPATWMWWQIDPPTPQGEQVSVLVAPGSGTSEISSLLESKGVIGSAWAFEVYVAASGASGFKAGQYSMHENMGVKAAIAQLKRGGAPVVAPTVKLDLGAPGLTLEQVSQRVATLGLDPAKFLKIERSGLVRSKYLPAGINTTEGLISPLVYEVPKGATEGDIAIMLRDEFDKHVDELGIANTTTASTKAGRTITPYEAMITASMIQREAGVPADRDKIAAVVYNRIHDNMPLQIDATILFAKGNFNAVLTLPDLAFDSPYNTYRIAGFPPTPIGTFDPDYLRAALNPAAISAKFYVKIDASGAHAFADTLAQHNANIAEAKKKGLL